MQLMPDKKNDKITIQNAEIKDYPRFKYRGMHLDVSRHFFPVSFVKQYIDILASYKINTFPVSYTHLDVYKRQLM